MLRRRRYGNDFPKGPLRLNSNSPQAYGLQCLWPNAVGPNLVNPADPMTTSDSLPLNPTPQGNVAREFQGAEYSEYQTEINFTTGTIFHWIVPNSTGHQIMFYMQDDGTNGDGFGAGNEIHTGVLSASKWNFTWYAGQGSRIEAATSYFTLGVPHFIVGTWNHSGELRLYVNGELTNTDDMTAFTYTPFTIDKTHFGKPGANTRYFSGQAWHIGMSSIEWTADMVRHAYDPTTRWDLYEAARTFVYISAAAAAGTPRTGLLLRGVG